MSRIAKFILTATAFCPVLLVHCAVAIMSRAYCIAVIFFIASTVLLVVCLRLMSFLTRSIARRSYTTKSVETADQEVMSFLLIYALPLISRDLSNHNWAVWLVIALFYCFVVTTGYGFHFNPLLSFCGYRFYKVTSEGGLPHVLITKRRIYEVGETLTVGRMVDFVLIEKTKPTSS